MKTVRARITALALVVSSLVLVLAGATLLHVLASELTSQGDSAARARAAELVEAAEDGSLERQVPPVTDDGFVQVLNGDGTVLASSPNLPDEPVDAPAPPPRTSTSSISPRPTTRRRSATGRGGPPWRPTSAR